MKRNLTTTTVLMALATLATTARAQDDGQYEALKLLHEMSAETPVVRFANDEVTFVSAMVPIEWVGGNPADPVDAAVAYLNAFAALYRLDPSSLVVQRIVEASNDDLVAHVFFGQRSGDTSVWGAQLAVHVDDRAILGTNGRYVVEPPLWGGPVDADFAFEIAAAESAPRIVRELGAPQPVIFDPGLIFTREELQLRELQPGARAAHRVTVHGSEHEEESPRGKTYFVDATTGRVLHTIEARHEVLGSPSIKVTSGGRWLNPFCSWIGTTPWFDQNGPLPGASPDNEGVTAFTAVRDYYKFLETRYSRDSLDGKGIWLQAILDQVPDPAVGTNAFYDQLCKFTVYDNDMATRDIVAHELTHGLVAWTAGFGASGQAGALNESYADIFGVFLDTNNFTIGEGSAIGTIRSISSPPMFGDPETMSAFVVTTADSGGVHTNAGIPNKAAFLIIAGGTQNGVTVSGIGRVKAEQLYFRTRSFLTPNATFQNAADMTVLAARIFATTGAHGFDNNDVCQVNNAFAAVELRSVDTDCDGLPDNADSDNDNDGINDSSDNCPLAFNPGQANTDGIFGDGGDACDPDDDNDGVLDVNDNCRFVVNPGQANSAGSGLGDACEDSDRDGVLDAIDNCKTSANSDQKDTPDGDGIGDACDTDADNDGIHNNFDTCPRDASAPQTDSDGDGLGDACDLCPKVWGGVSDKDHDGIGDECDADSDGDGVDNDVDNCVNVKNAIQLDTDHDGIGDACDLEQEFVDRLDIEMMLRGRAELFERFRTEIFPCINVPCPTRVPLEFKAVLDLSFDTPMYAQIVDADGDILAHGGPATEIRLEYAPATSFAFNRDVGDLEAGLGKTYFLETYTTTETDIREDYWMRVAGEAGYEW